MKASQTWELKLENATVARLRFLQFDRDRVSFPSRETKHQNYYHGLTDKLRLFCLFLDHITEVVAMLSADLLF